MIRLSCCRAQGRRELMPAWTKPALTPIYSRPSAGSGRDPNSAAVIMPYCTVTFIVPRMGSDGGLELQDMSDVLATYTFGAAFKAIGPDLARARGATSAQLLSEKGFASVLKWMERGVAPELDQRIHSWFALISVQLDSFPAAISMVHFAVRTGGRALEPAVLVSDATNAKTNPKHAVESSAARNRLGCLMADCLLRFTRSCEAGGTC